MPVTGHLQTPHASSSASSAKRVKSRRVEIIPGRLYWISDSICPSGLEDSFYFCVDNDLTYTPYNKDFGPLHIGNIFKYCVEVDRLLQQRGQSSSTPVLYHYTRDCPRTRANSLLLMGSFQILMLKHTAEEALERFPIGIRSSVDEYVDAGFRPSSYRCTVLDCLRGLEYATKLGWFSLSSFDIKSYLHYETPENGDLNWVVPGKFIAFSTPDDRVDGRGYTAEAIAPILKRLGVKTVVRLNEPIYNEKHLHRHGIDHHDVYFDDGSCPSLPQVAKFLRIAESARGAIAVHCKAGLGRTGTMIGLYLMKHFRFPAPALIGWMRLCRPGMVLGPQQAYLCEMQDTMFADSPKSLPGHLVELESRMMLISRETRHKGKRAQSPQEIYRAQDHQGDRLLIARDEHRHMPPPRETRAKSSLVAKLPPQSRPTPSRTSTTFKR